MKKQLLQTAIIFSMFLPLYGYAEEATSSVSTTTPEEREVKVLPLEEIASSTPSSPLQNFTLCSQEAIENRDTKIATSRSVYNVAMTKAVNDRKNKEKAAVAIVNENNKKNAMKASVDAYKNHVKSAQNNLTDSRKIAWQEFEDDIKECHAIQDKELEAFSQEETIQASEEPSQEATLKIGEKEEGNTLKDAIKAGIDTLRSIFH